PCFMFGSEFIITYQGVSLFYFLKFPYKYFTLT
ncbi:hypothetical protein M2142_000782, partial [Fusobacterium sp. PH5-29]